MELWDGLEHLGWHSEASEHFPQHVTVDGVVRFLQIDEAREYRDPLLLPELNFEWHVGREYKNVLPGPSIRT